MDLIEVKAKFSQLQELYEGYKEQKIRAESTVSSLDKQIAECFESLKSLTGLDSIEAIRQDYTARKTALENNLAKLEQEIQGFLDQAGEGEDKTPGLELGDL